MKIALFVSVLCLLGVGVECMPWTIWKPVSVSLKRAILAASMAAKFLEVEYISLLKAWTNVKTQVPYEEYRVIFKARCQYGILKQCQADVHFVDTNVKVSNAYCWKPDKLSKAQYLAIAVIHEK